MILSAFSKHLKSFNTDIPSIILLTDWLKENLSKTPENNVEKIINKELYLLRNRMGVFMILGKTKTGKILLESLNNYTESYDQHKFSKWIHKTKASDF